MRQRVIIAMALALKPELVIMDEPTTALDVVVQREILQQIDDAASANFGSRCCSSRTTSRCCSSSLDRIAIMYAGEIVERAPAGELLGAPLHPYTVGLLRVVPAAAAARVTA